MKRSTFRMPLARRFALVALLASTVWAGNPASATTYTWTGNATGSGDSSWSTSLNWANGQQAISAADTDLVFGAPGFPTANGTSTQNLVNPFTLRSLYFTNSAPAYVIGGGALSLGAGGISTSSTNTQTINNAVTLTADQTWGWDLTGGTLVLGGSINNNGHALTLNGIGANNALNAVISGTGSLAKAGNGTLTLTGQSTYTGATTVSSGMLAVVTGGSITGGNVSVSTGATLVISGTGSVAPGSNHSFI